jgi:hypothetical protein
MFSWGLDLASGILDICGEPKAQGIVDLIGSCLFPF